MAIRLFLIIAAMAALASCAGDADFQVEREDCGAFDIISPGGDSIFLQSRDTAWWVMQGNGQPLCMADKHKVSAFFNVLRDIQVMGLSSKSPDSRDYGCMILIRNRSGRGIKELRFAEVPGSPQMIGKVNGGKYYIVGVPGLAQSPAGDFSAAVEYWKDRLLLDLQAGSISSISVENFLDPAQGFSISASDGNFSVYASGTQSIDIPQQNIRQYLGSIAGAYRAAQYVDTASLESSDMIYRLAVRTSLGAEDRIEFFRKRLPDGSPDFNQMYFRKGADIGTAKYFDFDKILSDLDALR